MLYQLSYEATHGSEANLLSVKSNWDTLRIHIEIIVVLETPLAVIVMVAFGWRPPRRSFRNGEKLLEGVCDW